MTPARFPHSDTPGSTLGCQLPRAYRRLLRPSSALDAKASTTCPSQLVTHTTTPTPKPHHPHHRNPPPTNPTKRGRTNGTERHRARNQSGGAQHATKEQHTPTDNHGKSMHNTTTKQTSSQPPPRPTRHTPVQRAHTGSAQAHGSQPPDARVHYPDLKQQPQTPRARTPQRTPRRSQVPKPQTTPAGPARAA